MASQIHTLETLDTQTREAVLYEKLPERRLRCLACGHRCVIFEGLRGICKVRYNRDGLLYAPHGYVAALQCDPTEKKPFYHVRPGSKTLTFGMLGCDLHCGYCQNWNISQTLRDPSAGTAPCLANPDQLVAMAEQRGAHMIGSSYNEPLITLEWAMDIFRPAKTKGFRTAFISNGNATPEALEYIRPFTDCYKVDLKSMRNKNYQALGGQLKNVLDTIPRLVAMGFWVEVVTLIVPGFNDSYEELREAAHYLADVSKDIPWHVTAFHSDYKMQDRPDTPVETLVRAAQIGEAAGLNFVYAGNLPGQTGRYENTYCPSCRSAVILRRGFFVLQNRLDPLGHCPDCAYQLPGVWN
ncbi:MAG: AmmeMemoRadiSam system radical SAM enzyme [Acidobacteria bacterium]|nr:AmmeMemoRadiSam system radical SAM enzyme [Acidobacteriota bacterium]MBI3654854.1 AmmeMemoRadiSam system radical SAM enzyme [Acidobacteriota bacterium]